MHSAFLDRSTEHLNGEQTVEIVLDPEVLGALYRRGRRRLRDIQASSQAALKLDRLRGVLRATGTKESIADVQRQLESVSGSHLAVTAAVWAELMRTRAEPDMTQAAVARIQNESGCRIHIERNAQQVQLFGPKDTSFLAQHLLAKFERMCIEEIIDVQCPMDHMFLQKLQAFAQDFGVTLQVSETSITILGVKGAVIEAAKELHNCALDSDLDSTIDGGKPSNAARLAISTAMTNLTVDADKRIASTTMASPPLLPSASSMHSSDHFMQGAVTLKTPTSSLKPSFQQQSSNVRDIDLQQSYTTCPTCGGGGNFCVNCGNPTGKMMQGPGSIAGCPTCGVVNFCGYCGQRTEKKMMESIGTMQQRVPGSPSYGFEPTMFCAEQMPMMTMLPVQHQVQTAVQPGQPTVQTAMLPSVGSPTSQQVMVPIAMCIPYDASSQQQYLPLYAGN